MPQLNAALTLLPTRPRGSERWRWDALRGMIATVEKRMLAPIGILVSGFALRPLMPAYFIAFIGPADVCDNPLILDHNSAWRARSIHLHRDRKPDDGAIAIYEQVWFSSTPVDN